MHEPETENREERLAALEERVLQLERCVAESRSRRVIPYTSGLTAATAPAVASRSPALLGLRGR